MLPHRWRIPWIGLLLGAALLAGCGGEARTTADCDDLMGDGKYKDVIKECDNPYHRASAYLGLAGFDIFDLLNSSDDAGDVVAILGLTVDNIDNKRKLINKAVKEVKNPKDGSQAFALLVSAFLGFAVTVEQFLDNGDGATPLDYDFAASEIDFALGLTGPAVGVVLAAAPGADYFSVVHNSAAYTLDCTADATGDDCDDNPDTLVYADSSGAGILDIASPPAESGNKSAVLGAVATLAAAYPVQLLNVTLPYGFSAAQQDAVTDFLGSGGVGGVFDIGLGAYLQHLSTADDALAEFGGVPPGQTAISEDIDALVLQFDNGALKPSDGSACTLAPAYKTLMDTFDVTGLEKVYAVAAGTMKRPAPASPANGYFNNRNRLAASAISSDAVKDALPDLAAVPTTAFAALAHHKLLFPTVSGMVTFTPGNATARVDEAYTDFVTQFENIPLVLPAEPTADDGQINVLELLCSVE